MESYKKKYRGVSTEFGVLLKSLREGMDMSLKEVEFLCQISSSYLCRLESGDKSAPTLPILINLAKVYKISPLRLVEQALGNEVTHDEVDIRSLILTTNIKVNGKEMNQEVKINLLIANEIILQKEWDRKSECKLLQIIDKIKKI